MRRIMLCAATLVLAVAGHTKGENHTFTEPADNRGTLPAGLWTIAPYWDTFSCFGEGGITRFADGDNDGEIAFRAGWNSGWRSYSSIPWVSTQQNHTLIGYSSADDFRNNAEQVVFVAEIGLLSIGIMGLGFGWWRRPAADDRAALAKALASNGVPHRA